MKIKSTALILAGILAIVLAMPFGVYPCQFGDLSNCVINNGLISSVLGYLLIIAGIVYWIKENLKK